MSYNGKSPYICGPDGEPPFTHGFRFSSGSSFGPTNRMTREEQSAFLREGGCIKSEVAKLQIADQEERAKRPLYKRVLSLIPWIDN